MTALSRTLRRACLTILLLLLALPAAAQAADSSREYKVLVFTRAVGEQHASTAAGVKALKDLGKDNRFVVNATADPTEFRADRLKQFRAVVFLNTSGDVLNDAQQAAFEDYYRAGGGFVGVHSAIETESAWAFLTDVLGTRADARVGRDAGHDQGRRPRPRREQEPAGVLAAHRRVVRLRRQRPRPLARPRDGRRDHLHRRRRRLRPPVAWCKDYQGGRSFYTGGGHTAAAYGEPAFRRHLAGGIAWAAGMADPVYSDCGATVLANYEQKKISAPPNLNEPIGFDQLPDGRIIQTARAGQLRLHDPAANTLQGHRDAAGLHQQRGRPVRAGGRQRLRHQPLGLPLLCAA